MKINLNFAIAAILMGVVFLWFSNPIAIHSDGRSGINIRVLPIKYGLLSDEYRKQHQGEFWLGGCSVGINDAKWVVVY